MASHNRPNRQACVGRTDAATCGDFVSRRPLTPAATGDREFAIGCRSALDRFARGGRVAPLAAGDRGHVAGHVLRVLPGEQAGGHLALAAGATLVDRIQDEGGLEVAAVELVEVGTDAADRLGARQRVAGPAVLREQLAAVGLLLAEVDAAGTL